MPDGPWHDTKGRYYNSGAGANVMSSTLYPPNTSVPDQLWNCENNGGCI